MLNTIIANNLKSLRAQKQWSLAQAAKVTGVSKAMLGQIEREESSPTIAVLWKIATGFKVSMSSLIEQVITDIDHQEVSKPSIVFANIEFKVLFPFDPNLCCEMFAHYLQPQQTHLSQAHDQGVIEDIIVIAGELEMLVEGQWVLLKTGEALRFAADKAHGYRNLSEQQSVFHNIIHYPKKPLLSESND